MVPLPICPAVSGPSERYFAMDDQTYSITRMFFADEIPSQTIATGLTLEEAQAHCRDTETSSSTASPETLAAVGVDGPWFDGYDAE